MVSRPCDRSPPRRIGRTGHGAFGPDEKHTGGFLRICPNTEFKEVRVRGRSRWVSHPFAKNANGWGTERLYLVEVGKSQLSDRFLKKRFRCASRLGARS